MNLRAKKVVGSTTTLYIYNGSSLIAEYAGGAAATNPSKEYIGGGGALASVAAGVVTYYHRDLLSPRVESNGSGAPTRTYGHLPYGEDWYETGVADKWKFTTYERDAESQLNYAMNRFDSGRYGRFMSMDPLAGSLVAPQSLNRYTYAGNDPVNRVDPTGLLTDPACNHTDAGCGGGPGAVGWDFGSWDHGGFGGHGGSAGLEACGVDPYCIQRGGIGPFGSPVANGKNPALATYLIGGNYQIQTPSATLILNCVLGYSTARCTWDFFSLYRIVNGWESRTVSLYGAADTSFDGSLGEGVFIDNAAIFKHAQGAIETITVAEIAAWTGGIALGELGGTAAGDYLFARSTGLLNANDFLRIGYGWFPAMSTDFLPVGGVVMRIVIGCPDCWVHWHIWPF